MIEAEAPTALHFFVDEAGDPALFNSKGRILVGEEGCSLYFILGKLDVADPVALQSALDDLRTDLLADPYFKRVPSMQANQRKTALAFHAKDDIADPKFELIQVVSWRPQPPHHRVPPKPYRRDVDAPKQSHTLSFLA